MFQSEWGTHLLVSKKFKKKLQVTPTVQGQQCIGCLTLRDDFDMSGKQESPETNDDALFSPRHCQLPQVAEVSTPKPSHPLATPHSHADTDQAKKTPLRRSSRSSTMASTRKTESQKTAEKSKKKKKPACLKQIPKETTSRDSWPVEPSSDKTEHAPDHRGVLAKKKFLYGNGALSVKSSTLSSPSETCLKKKETPTLLTTPSRDQTLSSNNTPASIEFGKTFHHPTDGLEYLAQFSPIMAPGTVMPPTVPMVWTGLYFSRPQRDASLPEIRAWVQRVCVFCFGEPTTLSLEVVAKPRFMAGFISPETKPPATLRKGLVTAEPLPYQPNICDFFFPSPIRSSNNPNAATQLAKPRFLPGFWSPVPIPTSTLGQGTAELLLPYQPTNFLFPSPIRSSPNPTATTQKNTMQRFMADYWSPIVAPITPTARQVTAEPLPYQPSEIVPSPIRSSRKAATKDTKPREPESDKENISQHAEQHEPV